MQKIYVLDTNVLLCDPASILSFADRDFVIPMTVIEELDKKKNEAGELGYHARKVFRVLSDIRKIFIGTGYPCPCIGLRSLCF